MKKLFLSKILVPFLILLFLPIGAVHATTILYEATNLGGIQWEYTYFVTNDMLGVDIEEFSVFFELGLYDNLLATNTPANWDPLIAQPDPGIPDDGFYDALALFGPGIAPGDTLSGFSVQFDWLGTSGIPGSQFFQIFDPVTFDVLDDGVTAVPEPTTLLLVSLGLLGLAGLRKKFKK